MFNYLDYHQKKKLIIFFSIIILFLLTIIIISIILNGPSSTNNQVIIENLSSCANNISDESKNSLQKLTYDLVVKQNDLTGVSSENNYTASVRENSCKTTGNDETGFTSEIVLDIEELHYSFEITFFWSTNNTKDYVQNSPNFFCLEEDQMIYEPFSCEKNPYISEKLDPLDSLLPYFQDEYKLTAIPSGSTKSGLAILITYLPCEENCREKEAIKEEAKNYLKSNNINLENYLIYEKDYILK